MIDQRIPMAPILLVTKLHPPFVPAQTVARERLFELLRGGRGLKLSLVACPAGFGKSTLLAAWRESEARERPVAWVTLDEGDDDWSGASPRSCRACTGARSSGTPSPVRPTRRSTMPSRRTRSPRPGS